MARVRLAVCIATGPSLTQADVDLCRDQYVIAVSDAYRYAPWAAIVYACDRLWWEVHAEAVRQLPAERWTASRVAAKDYGLNPVEVKRAPGVSARPGIVHQGFHSGFHAMNLALHKAERVILLGYDCQPGPEGEKHCFGDHPEKLDREHPYDRWLAAYRTVKTDRVINCTRETAIDVFPRMSPEQALGG